MRADTLTKTVVTMALCFFFCNVMDSLLAGFNMWTMFTAKAASLLPKKGI